jgi:hypothetical protein
LCLRGVKGEGAMSVRRAIIGNHVGAVV